MTLTDTGPLVALLDRGDPYHPVCMAAAVYLAFSPMLTTWACFTEAMYLLGQAGGHNRQAALWGLRKAGRLRLHDLSATEVDRAAMLMEKYRDAPMDLADATLVAAAEAMSIAASSHSINTSGSTGWRTGPSWRWCPPDGEPRCIG